MTPGSSRIRDRERYAMNSKTGEVREFPSASEARLAGFDIPIHEADDPRMNRAQRRRLRAEMRRKTRTNGRRAALRRG